MKLYASSIRGKLMTLMMVVGTAAVLLAGVAYTSLSSVVTRRQTVEDLRGVADLVGGNCQAALAFGIPEDAEDVLGTLNTRPSIRLARVYDTGGNLFAQYPLEADAAIEALPDPLPEGALPGRFGYCVRRTIRVQDRAVGTIMLVDDLRNVSRELARNALILLFATALSLGAMVLISARLRDVIATPIISLTETVRHVTEERDYHVRVPAGGDDELGVLIGSFNQMLHEIEHRDTELLATSQQAELRADEAEGARRDLERAMIERHRAEQHEQTLKDRLARAERLESVGMLAGGVAHDLNNMLGPIVALPELMLMELDDLPDEAAATRKSLRQDLSMIETAAKRAAMVIGDLLSLSRRGNVTKRALDLNKIMSITKASPELIALSAEFPEVSITFSMTDEPLPVRGSDAHLVRILTNLTRNAAEAIVGTGSITLTTGKASIAEPMVGLELMEPGEYALITVADTGCGIDESEIARIFDPFYTKKQQGARSGTGLGLSLAHGIVKDHEGFLDLHSEIGKGTTFELYIPLEQGTVITSDVEPVKELPRGSERILIIDDDTGQRTIADRTLSALGYDATTAASGREGVALVRALGAEGSPPYDLILLDMIMEADFDGVETYTAITELHPDQRFIVISGYTTTERGQLLLSRGVPWVSKPYSTTTLAQVVRVALDSSPVRVLL